MDYTVKDSSLYYNTSAFKEFYGKDTAVRVGIVRSESKNLEDETTYVVEVINNGTQVPVPCILLTRFGGPYNYEEYKLKSWGQNVSGDKLPPTTASTYDLRDGDVVLVAFIDGKSREGVILGCLRHPSRPEKTEDNELSYISEYNGLETRINKDGSYKVTFKGAPLNDNKKTPPGEPVKPPEYNEEIAGSYFGFEETGSFIASDGKQSIEIIKQDGTIEIKSGENLIVLDSGTNTLIKTEKIITSCKEASMDVSGSYKLKSKNLSLQGNKIAIGNAGFELFDGLSRFIDAIGTLVIMSPTGTCVPIQGAPTWAQVLAIKQQIDAIKGKIENPDSA